ncbi:MAG: T9SS type A sorting domain-containing protein [Candidatus Kapaibacterium sp.]
MKLAKPNTTVLFAFILSLFVVVISTHNKAYSFAEENSDSLGINITTLMSSAIPIHHSTFHFELTKFLLIKSGFSNANAELIARYCSLSDNANPINYLGHSFPYESRIEPLVILGTITFTPQWSQSIAGTERCFTMPPYNSWQENSFAYIHYATRRGTDTLLGGYVYGSVLPISNNQIDSAYPKYWRIGPNPVSIDSLKNWALYDRPGLGGPGDKPNDIWFCDTSEVNTIPYQKVQAGSFVAFAILLHSVADSYSHEDCMFTSKIRTHPYPTIPPSPSECKGTYHRKEMAYDSANYGFDQVHFAAQALWRVIREYKRTHPGVAGQTIWTEDNNGFQDGDGIPDELEEHYDPQHNLSFIERWKSPAPRNMNPEFGNVIDHSDHTAYRIFLCDSALSTGINFVSNEIPSKYNLSQNFPNPFNPETKIQFDIPKNSFVRIKVFNVAGRELAVLVNQDLIAGKYAVNWHPSNIASGVYFYTIETKNFRQSKRMILLK